MDRDEWTDRLADAFLSETLGGDLPRDRTRQILARAAGLASRRTAWRVSLAAAAAVLAAAGAAWLFWSVGRQRAGYPAPAATGAYTVQDGGPVRRGAVVETDTGEAKLTLGGYAEVRMRPGTSVLIGGAESAEEIVLARGEVECEVETQKDETFSVQTELGTVSVVGTHFTVRLTGKEAGVNGRRMWVTVMVGAVMVTGLDGAQSVLQAGERRAWGDRARTPWLRRDPRAVENPETPLEKEYAALRLQEQLITAKRQQMEAAVLQGPALAVAMKASVEATRAYHAKLKDNIEYGDLKKDKENLVAERRKLFSRTRRARGREQWQERMRKSAELRKASDALQQKMNKLADNTPELVALKKKKEQAIAAFLATYQEKLAADKEYVELGKQLDEVAKWSQEVRDLMDDERMKRYREERDQRRREAEAARDKDKQKEEP